MRRGVRSSAVVALTVVGAVAAAAPAVAAPAAGAVAAPVTAPGPSAQSSCVAEVFVPQATGEPRAIAVRIAEIKGFIEVPWGQVVEELLARWDGCRAE